MKKIFLVILTFVSAMFLNSCSKSDVMLSGDWWTLLPDEVGSGSEDLVIRFNSANSTINFALTCSGIHPQHHPEKPTKSHPRQPMKK